MSSPSTDTARSGAQSALYDQTWRLSRVQMFNWGCFHGPVAFDVAPRQTVIVGMSGAGKSTILDAHTALLNDGKTAFNAASNPARTGHARGETARNVPKYMRGRIADSTDADGHTTWRSLRDSTVWSGIAETFHRPDGQVLTAWVAYYMPEGAPKPTVTRWALTVGEFNLRDLDPFTRGEHRAKPLPKERIRDTFRAVEFCDGPGDFRARLYQRLGLTREAVRLLHTIQSSAGFSSITHLFQTMVLDEPETFAAADRALAHFVDAETAYQNLLAHEKQTRLLEPIRQWRSDLLHHREEARFYAQMVATAEPADNPYWQWARDVQARLLEDAEDDATEAFESAQRKHSSAKMAEHLADKAVTAARRRVAAAGGDRLTVIDEQIDAARLVVQKAVAARNRLEARLDGRLPLPASRAEHAAALEDAHQWLSAADARRDELTSQRDAIVVEKHALDDEARALRDEGTYLSRRRDLVPQDLHEDRCRFAEAAGLNHEQVPFLAELIDMDPQWEQWRMAVEKALGGLAHRLLVPDRSAHVYRAAVESIVTGRRYRWEPVPSAVSDFTDRDPRTAAGRLVLKPDHPYAPWLSGRLADALDYLCVDNVDDLGKLPRRTRGLTITGQTWDGRLGAHGGQRNHRPVIGFSPQARLDQIAARMGEIQHALTRVATDLTAATDRDKTFTREHAARERLVETTWEELDENTARDAVAALERERQKALDAAPDLAEAEAELDLLVEEAKGAAQTSAATGAQRDLTRSTRDQIVDEKDAVTAHQDRMLAADVPFVDHDRLTAQFIDHYGHEPTRDRFTLDTLRAFASHVNGRSGKSKQTAAELEERLRQRFIAYNLEWPDRNRGDDPDDNFDDFDAILTNHLAAGLDQFRDDFIKWVSRVTGIELVALSQSFTTAKRSVSDRLDQINAVLTRLDYSSRGGHVTITPSTARSAEVDTFLTDLNRLSSDATTALDFDSAQARFDRLQPLMEQIADDRASRARILDVRRHLRFAAHHSLPDGRTDVYDASSDQSGGEYQEMAMFVLGVALRYQLGSLDTDHPRFAPVFMDEGMVKADPEHTHRALSVWTTLGFQPIIAIPVEKFESTQQGEPAPTLQVSRDPDGRSRVDWTVPLP